MDIKLIILSDIKLKHERFYYCGLCNFIFNTMCYFNQKINIDPYEPD